MNIKDLCEKLASITEQRDIIHHGSIRCLFSDAGIRDIALAEDIDREDVGVSTIGSDELAEKLGDIASGEYDFLKVDPQDLAEGLNSLLWLVRANGPTLNDYIEKDEEDELKDLDGIILRAQEFADLFKS